MSTPFRSHDISDHEPWSIQVTAIQRDGPDSKWTVKVLVYDTRKSPYELAWRNDDLGQFDNMAEALHQGREIMMGKLDRHEVPFF